MSIVKMRRMALVGLDVEKEALISRLMDFGLLEVTDQTPKLQDETWAGSTSIEDIQERVQILENRINQSQLALDVIDKYGELKAPFFATRRKISKNELDAIDNADERGWSKVNFIIDLQNDIVKTNEVMNRHNQEIQSLIPWQELDFSMEACSTRTTDTIFGVFPLESDFDEIASRLEQEIGAVVSKQVSADKDTRYVAFVCLKECTEVVTSLIKPYGFNIIDFDDLSGTIKHNIERLSEEVDIEKERFEGLKNEIKENVEIKRDIEEFQDNQRIKLDNLKIKSKLLVTKRTFFVEGWVPEKAEAKLKKILDGCECFYEFRDPEEGENVPVLLKNSSFFSPVEAITNMYSLPDYHGVDPTSIYALFYICFFGMMFSDAGYGIILAAGCFAVLKKFDLEGNMYNMIKMFMYCGISTLFWGIMFGGFFGDLISAFTKTFLGHEIAIPAVWFNPLDDPMTLLIFSLILGVIHLFVGMGLNAYMEIRDGQIMDAIFNEGSWFVTIPGLALWLAGGMIGMPQLSPVGKYMAIAGLVMLIVGGARGKKGFGMLTGAFSNVYSITSWLSDILSYARLLALGLATGVIAQVVNVMGTLFGGGIAGVVLFIIIFVVGTAINFAINVLGSFIHAARLQYVEFFGKFYKDGGDAFTPFKRNTKYIKIEDEANNIKL